MAPQNYILFVIGARDTVKTHGRASLQTSRKRYLKKLQEEGLVMYEGNKRTGGYFPKNYIFAPDFNDKVKY